MLAFSGEELAPCILFQMMQLVIVIEVPSLNIPPPFDVALLPEIVQLIMVNEEETLFIPPPESALLPEMRQLVIVIGA